MLRPAAFAVFLLIALLGCRTLADTLKVIGPAGSHTYTQESILDLGGKTLETETPWTDGLLEFTGVPLQRLLAEAGIEHGKIAAEALNGYSVDIPVEPALAAQAFIAVQINGEPMRVKDKGPFWIIFPWSSHPTLNNRDVRAWSIWQLTRLQVLE